MKQQFFPQRLFMDMKRLIINKDQNNDEERSN